ncbi:hypothetical protein IGI04_042894 [Brassica rapa subsp. trilocularis]|uniref:Uncharacterized protein n=1 Tax=Brassica rapa subsp. trilocularis TaxID=1813537 RepID=A0ABQ7KI81_BRACM|nr:hypothetical protein IGI04_042894 [Brassica rapa subsp. trilocularis]
MLFAEEQDALGRTESDVFSRRGWTLLAREPDALSWCAGRFSHLGTKLFFHLILSSDPYASYYISVSILLSYDQTFVNFEFCSSNHHIGVYLLIICSFDLCEYLV